MLHFCAALSDDGLIAIPENSPPISSFVLTILATVYSVWIQKSCDMLCTKDAGEPLNLTHPIKFLLTTDKLKVM
jgi:hypothetical protein